MKELLKIYSLVLLIVAFCAVAGGYGLIFMKGLGMPAEWVSPAFSSFLVPGIILAIVVGGTHLVASILLWRRTQLAAHALAIAGFGMIIWIFTEMYILNQSHWLHALFFAEGVATLIFSLLVLKSEQNTRVTW